MISAALYCRKSTEQNVAEEAKSIPMQLARGREFAAAQGWDVLASSPADFAMALKSELDKWSAVIKSAKIKGDN